MPKTDDQVDQAPGAPGIDAAALHSVLTSLATAIQGDQEANRKRERDAIGRLLDSHDERRAKGLKVMLKAVTPFTLVTDEHPEGKVVNRGDEFEVAEFDLPRYLGRGLPAKNEPEDKNGVTISQA